jgi:hypothetical protein
MNMRIERALRKIRKVQTWTFARVQYKDKFRLMVPSYLINPTTTLAIMIKAIDIKINC